MILYTVNTNITLSGAGWHVFEVAEIYIGIRVGVKKERKLELKSNMFLSFFTFSHGWKAVWSWWILFPAD